MATVVGLPILFQASSDPASIHAGIIAGNITNSGNTADLICFSSGVQWEDTESSEYYAVQLRKGVSKGTGANTWQENTAVLP